MRHSFTNNISLKIPSGHVKSKLILNPIHTIFILISIIRLNLYISHNERLYIKRYITCTVLDYALTTVHRRRDYLV